MNNEQWRNIRTFREQTNGRGGTGRLESMYNCIYNSPQWLKSKLFCGKMEMHIVSAYQTPLIVQSKRKPHILPTCKHERFECKEWNTSESPYSLFGFAFASVYFDTGFFFFFLLSVLLCKMAQQRRQRESTWKQSTEIYLSLCSSWLLLLLLLLLRKMKRRFSTESKIEIKSCCKRCSPETNDALHFLTEKELVFCSDFSPFRISLKRSLVAKRSMRKKKIKEMERKEKEKKTRRKTFQHFIVFHCIFSLPLLHGHDTYGKNGR